MFHPVNDKAMKRIPFYPIIILFACACTQDFNDPAPEVTSARVHLTALRPETRPADATRVEIRGDQALWSQGDALGVFTADATAPVPFRLYEGAGTATGGFTGALAAGDGEELYVLYPYLPDTLPVRPEAARIALNGQTQDGFGRRSEAHLGRYAYMASVPVRTQQGQGALQLRNLGVKMSFEFALPEPATVRFLTLSTSDELLYDRAVVDLTAPAPAAAPWGTPSRTLSMGFVNGAVQAGERVTAHMMMLPHDLTAQAVTFYIAAERPDGKPVTYTVQKPAGLRFEASASYTAEIAGLSVIETPIPMVYVPGGSLNICALAVAGKTDEEVLEADYKVNSFWVARTEVTNAQYCDFLNARKPNDVVLNSWLATNGWSVDTEQLQIEKTGGQWRPKSGPILEAGGTQRDGSYADYPMQGVTFNGANAYATWLAETMCGYKPPFQTVAGRYLPSEAQWEYAATGSEWNPGWLGQVWAGSSDPMEVMWSNLNCDTPGSSCMGMYVGNGDDPNSITPAGSHTGGTHPVASLEPNFLGIYDLSGNVSEICRDWYHVASFPYGSNRLDPWCSDMSAAESYYGEQCRSCRGGLWSSYAVYGITFYRDYITTGYYSNALGFRPILPLP